MKYFLPLIGCLLISVPGVTQRDCRSTDYRKEQLKADPELASSIEAVEQFTRLQLHRSSVTVTGPIKTDVPTPLITIPIVVHILYNTPVQNISDAQVLSQLDVLNADYQKRNADTTGIPGYFRSFAADCGFRFVLATSDTGGASTTGIIRKHTNNTSFSLSDDAKFASRGGDDAWDRNRYLNIWVCNLTGGFLGYSSVVGGAAAIDGVVILYTAFGTKGTATVPFNRGRTTTHEIGHWLNMIHIWGDEVCGNDEVADTPPQSAATYGDPSGIIVSCGNSPYGNMYMDYMDFTDDIGMHMFTLGQSDRMRSLFAAGGFRYPLLSSNVWDSTTITSVDPSAPGGGNEPAISVFPNPAANVITVQLSSEIQPGALLEIYNQVGQRVMTTRVMQPTFQLNVSGLSGGVYFIRCHDGGESHACKMVKQ